MADPSRTIHHRAARVQLCSVTGSERIRSDGGLDGTAQFRSAPLLFGFVGSERKLRRQLHDSRVERAGDLAKRRRTVRQVEARSPRQVARQRDTRAEAVGDVESLAADFEAVCFTNRKLPR